MTSPSSAGPGDAWLRAMPVVFVLIWSTGFVVARLAMPHAPPMGFLAWRYALSVGLFLVWVWWSRPAWPQDRTQVLHLAVTGMLMHGGYLGGVWAAVKSGIGAGTVSLLVGLQPMLTALWITGTAPASTPSVGGPAAARAAHGRVLPIQWVGLLLGLVGLSLVVWRKLGIGEITAWNFGLAMFALFCITAGTLYQKRHVAPCDVRTANTVQLLAAFAVTLPLALIENEAFEWHPHLLGAMVWSVVVLTLGGSSLLYLLIQRGAATQVTSLLYLVPPCTAMLAWLLFDESFTPLMLIGMVLTVAGVALVLRVPRR
jgi:drug/metabolite transporter (DMT)-like permease